MRVDHIELIHRGGHERDQHEHAERAVPEQGKRGESEGLERGAAGAERAGRGQCEGEQTREGGTCRADIEDISGCGFEVGLDHDAGRDPTHGAEEPHAGEVPRRVGHVPQADHGGECERKLHEDAVREHDCEERPENGGGRASHIRIFGDGVESGTHAITERFVGRVLGVVVAGELFQGRAAVHHLLRCHLRVRGEHLRLRVFADPTGERKQYRGHEAGHAEHAFRGRGGP